MLVAESLVGDIFSLRWRFSQCIKSVINILNRSPTSQTCHQHIRSSTSVTNIDVTYCMVHTSEFLVKIVCIILSVYSILLQFAAKGTRWIRYIWNYPCTVFWKFKIIFTNQKRWFKFSGVSNANYKKSISFPPSVRHVSKHGVSVVTIVHGGIICYSPVDTIAI